VSLLEKKREIYEWLEKEVEKEIPTKPTFKFDKEGKTLIGQVKDIRHIETRVGETIVADLEDREGKLWSVFISPMDLRRKWGDADIAIGDFVAIRFVRMSGAMKIFNLKVYHGDGTRVSLNFVVDTSLPIPAW